MSKHKHERKCTLFKTTSETLRLGEVEVRMPPPTQAPRKKIQNSSSSFQITAVTRIDPDDSADDLDTDEMSRVTDNETPSFSEDSRDTDDHQVLAEPPPEPPEVPGARFKVVKMPSPTPINRGRWVCVDYFDNTGDTAYSTSFINVQQEIANNLKPAAAIRNGSQGFTTNLYRQVESVVFADNQISTFQKKDDILSDIKNALTSVPTNPGRPASNNNIDRKIEEALDAVKTHLMVAVHKEVDFLKTRVSTLEGRVNELEIENSILRVNYLLFKS